MSIFITGDTHGDVDVHKITRQCFDYSGLTKDDYLIIAGDFGFVWYGNRKDEWWLKWVNNLPCTVLFCDGNHENFDALDSYPIEEWQGGKVHRIKDTVFHLMRGQVFTIDNLKFFVFGGASSHDKEYRKEGVNWWPQEIPNEEEKSEAIRTLDENNWEVDYVITHCAPSKVLGSIEISYDAKDSVTDFLDTIDDKLMFRHWYFGHYHVDKKTDDKHTVIYNKTEYIK